MQEKKTNLEAMLARFASASEKRHDDSDAAIRTKDDDRSTISTPESTSLNS